MNLPLGAPQMMPLWDCNCQDAHISKDKKINFFKKTLKIRQSTENLQGSFKDGQTPHISCWKELRDENG